MEGVEEFVPSFETLRYFDVRGYELEYAQPGITSTWDQWKGYTAEFYVAGQPHRVSRCKEGWRARDMDIFSHRYAGQGGPVFPNAIAAFVDAEIRGWVFDPVEEVVVI